MSLETGKSKTILEHSQKEQEEALLLDAPKLVERVISGLTVIWQRPDLLKPVQEQVGRELKEMDMKDATITIAILEVATNDIRKNIEELRSDDDTDNQEVATSIKNLEIYYARLSALKEILLREHEYLSRHVEPFKAGGVIVREVDLRSWAAGFKNMLEHSSKTEENKEDIVRHRQDILLLDLFLKKPDRLEPRHYDELIDLLGEEAGIAAEGLETALQEHFSSSKKIAYILEKEEFIEFTRNFISILDGMKAEKIALGK